MLPTTVVLDARTSRAFVANLGSVSVLDTRNGTVVATTLVGRIPSDAAVDTRTDRVFVANRGEGTVSVLDARNGRLVATVPVGHGPWAVAVASGVGHVYVANADDGTVSVLEARNGRVLRTAAVGISRRDAARLAVEIGVYDTVPAARVVGRLGVHPRQRQRARRLTLMREAMAFPAARLLGLRLESTSRHSHRCIADTGWRRDPPATLRRRSRPSAG